MTSPAKVTWWVHRDTLLSDTLSKNFQKTVSPSWWTDSREFVDLSLTTFLQPVTNHIHDFFFNKWANTANKYPSYVFFKASPQIFIILSQFLQHYEHSSTGASKTRKYFEYPPFYIRTNFIGTKGMKLVKNKNKLRTFWGWKVQKQKTKTTIIYIFFRRIYLKKNDLNTIKIIFCDVLKKNDLNTIKIIFCDVIKCSIEA